MCRGPLLGTGLEISQFRDQVIRTIPCSFGRSSLPTGRLQRTAASLGASGLMEGQFTNVHMCITQLTFYAVLVLLASLDSCSRFVSSFASIICPYHPTRAFQNGPLHILANYSLVENQYAWSTVADYVWIDQPVYVRILVNVEVDTTCLLQWNWIQYC